MREIKEFFDEIARFESSIIDPPQMEGNVLKVRCKKLAFYDHPLGFEFGNFIENKNMYFCFNEVFSSIRILHPYFQEIPFKKSIWLPEVEIEDIKSQSMPPEHYVTYDLSELNHISPTQEIPTAFVQKWLIVAKSFSLFIDV
jgi:hypothetical protein